MLILTKPITNTLLCNSDIQSPFTQIGHCVVAFISLKLCAEVFSCIFIPTRSVKVKLVSCPPPTQPLVQVMRNQQRQGWMEVAVGKDTKEIPGEKNGNLLSIGSLAAELQLSLEFVHPRSNLAIC